MSTSLLLPNPCLLGIVFCISTHDGNQLVFHYPPNPNEYGFKPTPLDNQVLDTDNDNYSSSSSSSSDSELDGSDVEKTGYFSEGSASRYSRGSFGSDSGYSSYHQSGSGSHKGSFDAKYASGRDILEIMDERDRRRKRKASKRLQKLNTAVIGDNEELNSPSLISNKTPNSNGASLFNSPNINSQNEKTEFRIEKLFSFDIDFISDLATPPKALCNNRFEVTVEDMVFLGLPIRMNDDGNWRSLTRKMAKRKSVSTRNRSSRRESVRSDDIRKTKSHNTNDESDAEKDKDDQADQNCDNDSSMYQFNLLFVMNPPVVEYNHRIDEMFHYIVSRLALLLRYEQQNNNYIWEESQKIMKLKEELIHLPISTQWDQIIEKTSLGKLIYQTYESISKSDILNVEINGRMRSFQIPIRTVFSSLPPRTLEIPKGSTLSSLSPFNQLNSIESTAHLDMNDHTMGFFALILLDDVESIIRDIRVDKDSVFASFIRMINPSESLNKLSVLSGLGLPEVKLFANHLVYWRRAKAILPISSRNTYIVSPMSPIKQIYKDATRFNRNFPNLPPITTFLAMISDISNSKPKPISTIIPSKDHKDLYLDAISWLLKYGYLVQLCSFVYLKITKEIKIEVDEEVEMEMKKKQEAARRRRQTNRGLQSDEPNTTEYDSETSLQSDIGSETSDNEANNGSTLIKKSNTNNSNEHNSNVTDSVTLGKTRNTDNTAEVNVEITNSVADSIEGISESKSEAVVFEEEEEEDTILMEPEYANAIERRWIAKIVADKPPEIVGLFYKLLKHMNGKKALEIFIVQENVSRNDLKKLLEELEDYIVLVRHW